jgi:hypothetical protein
LKKHYKNAKVRRDSKVLDTPSGKIGVKAFDAGVFDGDGDGQEDTAAGDRLHQKIDYNDIVRSTFNLSQRQFLQWNYCSGEDHGMEGGIGWNWY